jgi:hypothetical protein
VNALEREGRVHVEVSKHVMQGWPLSDGTGGSCEEVCFPLYIQSNA